MRHRCANCGSSRCDLHDGYVQVTKEVIELGPIVVLTFEDGRPDNFQKDKVVQHISGLWFHVHQVCDDRAQGRFAVLVEL